MKDFESDTSIAHMFDHREPISFHAALWVPVLTCVGFGLFLGWLIWG